MGYTTPNWPDLDSFVLRATDVSPIRFFDENKITPGSVYSHIIALELLIGNQFTRLQEANYSLSHISLSFAVECNEEDISLFMDLYAHKITRLNRINRQDVYFILISMTLREWKDSILRYCHRTSDKYIREVFNNFYQLLYKANLGELFDCYERIHLDDGTFSLHEEQ